MASEILRVSSVPVSLDMTQLMSQNATARASREIPMMITNGNFIDCVKSIQASGKGIGAERRCVSSTIISGRGLCLLRRENVKKTSFSRRRRGGAAGKQRGEGRSREPLPLHEVLARAGEAALQDRGADLVHDGVHEVEVVVGEQPVGGELLGAQQMAQIGARVRLADEARARRVERGEVAPEA